MIHGLWKVTGSRIYRGHQPNTEFEASINEGPASRAVARGDIALLERFVPQLPAEYQLPRGWTE